MQLQGAQQVQPDQRALLAAGPRVAATAEGILSLHAAAAMSPLDRAQDS